MQNSMFLKLLATLEPEELTAFGKYLKRQHGQESIALDIFRYVKGFHPGFEDAAKLEKGHAYRKIFKENLEQAGNRTRLLNALSDLHLWLTEFLMLEKLRQDDFEQQTLWMSILKERKLSARLSTQVLKVKQMISAKPKTSILDYMKGMFAQYALYYHLTENKQATDIQSLESCALEMDLFYAVSRLKLACEMLNRRNMMELPYDLQNMPAVLALVQGASLQAEPLVQLYLLIYQLLEAGDRQIFTAIRDLLEQYPQIEREEVHTAISYLHNFATTKVRQGNADYWQLIHQIDRFWTSRGAFQQNISITQFNNIVNTAALSNAFDWAAAFIQDHQSALPETFRASTVCLSNAILAFEQKQFQQALNWLAKGDFKTLLEILRARSLFLRAHYEAHDESIDLVDQCILFERYLKQHNSPRREAVSATLNFVKILKMLVRRKAPKAKIWETLQAAKPIYFKPWLLEKLGQYRG